jgi:LAO/AO transport system kinase
MQRHATDDKVFIRSLATRGYLGGLSQAVRESVRVLDAAGFDTIVIETVGVGQSEVDIVRCADTIVLVSVPGLGDDIQAIKAGVMEIGDVFAVNKADREGAEKTCRETKAMLDFKTDWEFKPPVCLTAAETGEGVDALLENIITHKNYLSGSNRLAEKRARKKAAHVRDIIRDRLDRGMEELIASYTGARDEGKDPYSLSDGIMSQIDFSKPV